MKYYRLTENMTTLNKWYLGEINDLLYTHQWGFTMSPLFSIDEKLSIPIKINGLRTDFTENLTYDVPILSNRAKNILKFYKTRFSDVDVLLDGELDGKYYAMGVDIIDVIDERQSKYIKYEKDDPIRPDKEGDYKYFNEMVLSRSKIGGNHIFRIKGYVIYLVVSEELKSKIESEHLTGFAFEELTLA